MRRLWHVSASISVSTRACHVWFWHERAKAGFDSQAERTFFLMSIHLPVPRTVRQSQTRANVRLGIRTASAYLPQLYHALYDGLCKMVVVQNYASSELHISDHYFAEIYISRERSGVR